jgi:hypothetical protein
VSDTEIPEGFASQEPAGLLINIVLLFFFPSIEFSKK